MPSEMTKEDELADALWDMVEQHCFCAERDDKQRKMDVPWVYDSGALSSNAYAFKVLVNLGYAEYAAEGYGRRQFIRRLPKVEETITCEEES